jgi:hypothetical protein
VYKGIVILLMVLLSSGCLSEAETKYQDPDNPANYIIVNPVEHSYLICQENEKPISGTYTETSEAYSFNVPFGSITAVKNGNSVISPLGNAWMKV